MSVINFNFNGGNLWKLFKIRVFLEIFIYGILTGKSSTAYLLAMSEIFQKIQS